LRRWVGALVSDIRGRHYRDDASSASLSLPVLSQVRQVLREVEDAQRLEIDYQENWTPSHCNTSSATTSPRRRSWSSRIASRTFITSTRSPADGPGTGERHGHCARAGRARVCGTWIAHGSGEADREVIDRKDGVEVPPDAPATGCGACG